MTKETRSFDFHVREVWREFSRKVTFWACKLHCAFPTRPSPYSMRPAATGKTLPNVVSFFFDGKCHAIFRKGSNYSKASKISSSVIMMLFLHSERKGES